MQASPIARRDPIARITGQPPFRIGILGAASVATYGMIGPAAQIAELTVAAVGARDLARGRAFAAVHAIPAVGSYDDVLADTEIDAIYLALANDAHAHWAARTIESGKPLLCEKPLTLNAREAAACVDLARERGVLFLEAFHWRCHPIAARLQALVAAEEIGPLRSVDVFFSYAGAAMRPGDHRSDFALGGGVMLDAGSYGVNLLRLLLGEPLALDRAAARVAAPQVDVAMDASLTFAGGVKGRVTATSESGTLTNYALLIGERGRAMVHNPFLPAIGCSIDFACEAGNWIELVDSESSHLFQARHFAQVLAGEAAPLIPASDAVPNLAVVDMIYRGAGLLPRGEPLP